MKHKILDAWLKAQEKERSFWLQVKEERYLFISKALGFFELKYDFKALQDLRVLQVGPGPNGTINFLKEAKIRVGVDPLMSFYMQKFDTLLDREVHYITGIGERLMFRKHVFDLVIAENLLDHVISPYKVLLEMRRALSHNGVVLLENVVWGKFAFFIRKYFIRDEAHPHFFTLGMLKQLLLRAGLQPKIIITLNERLPFNVNRYLKLHYKATIPHKIALLTNKLLSFIFKRQSILIVAMHKRRNSKQELTKPVKVFIKTYLSSKGSLVKVRIGKN